MSRLTKDLYSVIADYIPDIQTWYNYCLTSKLVWSVCQPKVKKKLLEFTYLDIRKEYFGIVESCWRLVKHTKTRHGPYTVTYNGRLSREGHFRMGQRFGTFSRHSVLYETKVWECQYKNGRALRGNGHGPKHGEEKEWILYENPPFLTKLITWFEGFKHGPLIYYKRDGTKKLSVLYRHGKIVGLEIGDYTSTDIISNIHDGWCDFYDASTGKLVYHARMLDGEICSEP